MSFKLGQNNTQGKKIIVFVAFKNYNSKEMKCEVILPRFILPTNEMCKKMIEYDSYHAR